METFLGFELRDDKFMEYEDGRKISYKEIYELSFGRYFKEGEKEFLLSLDNEIYNIVSEGKITHDFQNKVFNSIEIICKNSLNGRKEDGTFYSNFIYDLGESIKNNEELKKNRLYPFIKFVHSGMNMWKIRFRDQRLEGGRILEFMPTELALECCENITDNYECHGLMLPYFEDFLSLFRGVNEAREEIKAFNNFIQSLKIDITFEKTLNTYTGANAYNVVKAAEEYKLRSEEKKVKITSEIRTNFNKLISNLEEKCDEIDNEESINIIMWNISEYLCRYYCC